MRRLEPSNHRIYAANRLARMRRLGAIIDAEHAENIHPRPSRLAPVPVGSGTSWRSLWRRCGCGKAG